MMKKTKTLILVIAASILIVGCGTTSEKNQNNDNQNKTTPNKQYTTTLIDNITKSDILLYEKTAFTEIEFNVRDSISYTVGKDFYRIAFLTNAKPKDTYNAYIKYLDEITEELKNEYQQTIEGKLNGLPISISILQEYNTYQKGYPVAIRISEKPSEYKDQNPYFNEYPQLVELYKKTNQPHYYYQERYLDNIKQYYITYKTSANNDEFATYYTNNYSQKQNYLFEEDQHQKKFTWTDSEHEHKILLQKSNSIVGIYVETKLQ